MTLKNNNINHDTSQRYGYQPTTRLIDRLVRPVVKRYGLAASQLITDWQTIAGPYMGSLTCPMKILFPKGERTNGVLHLMGPSSIAVEIVYHQNTILDRINHYFGYLAITDIKMHHGHVMRHQPPREKDIAFSDQDDALLDTLIPCDDQNDPLYHALRMLGRSVILNENNS